MNAPLPEHVRRALDTVTLDDKYSLDVGRAFMSGVQALVKLPMLQRQRDALQGKNTAGFISGYRGSPLGGYDQSLWKAKDHLKAQNIVFQPGVNEELAATALWGTQQLGFAPTGSNRFDGVFGIWYGKGPGVDRCSDVFKHANMAGTTPWGGVIAVAGDDHVAKSSTAAHQSDHIFKACGLPVFFPTSVQDILDLGLHAIAMSRFSGVWAGMKTIQEIVESSATAVIDPDRVNIVIPDFEMPPGGLHIRWPDHALDQEARLFDHKWYAALAYVRANRLNHNVIEGPNDRYGVIASGKNVNGHARGMVDGDLQAYASAGVNKDDVDAYWFGTAQSAMSGIALARALQLQNKPVTRVENYCATGSEALRQASYALAAGAYDLCMVVGAEKVKDTGFQGLNANPIPNDGTARTLTAAAMFSIALSAVKMSTSLHFSMPCAPWACPVDPSIARFSPIYAPRAWMDNYHPMCFGDRLWVVPSWTPPPTRRTTNAPTRSTPSSRATCPNRASATCEGVCTVNTLNWCTLRNSAISSRGARA